MPQLCIVIPTLNRGRLFHDTVRQLVDQRFRDWELWCIDQSDPEQRDANTAFVASLRDPRIHYVHIDRKSLPNARNEALARLPDCEVVLFLDDDVILLDPGFLDAHLAPYAEAKVGGVSGRIVERSVRPNVDEVSCHLSPGGRTLTNMWGTEPCALLGLKGANMSYRMAAVRQVGGFDRQYTGTALLEDTDYSHRVLKAGWTLWYNPAAELIHLSAPTGGVRVEDAARAEYWRFRSTAYWVLKHRGVAGFPLFCATFGAIAASRAIRWRSPAAAGRLFEGIRDGVAAFRQGPDEALP